MSQRYLAPIKTMNAPPAWVPSDKTGLISWFRADTVVVDGGNNVTSWTDQSGNGYNATPQAAGPLLVTNVINGQPVIRFTGASSHRLNFAGATALLDKSTANTIVVITKGTAQLTAGNFGVFLSVGATGSTRFSVFNAEVATYEQLTMGGGTGAVDTNCGVTTFDYYSAFYSYIGQFNGAGSFSTAANWTVTKNGASQSLVNGAGAVNTSATLSTIGSFGASGLFYSGDIAEIIIWNSNLSGGEATDLATYISTRYGL